MERGRRFWKYDVTPAYIKADIKPKVAPVEVSQCECEKVM
jgi:hypothetical protein